MSPATSVSEEKKERQKGKRGNAAPNDIRNVLKLAERFLSDFPFAEDRVNKLIQAINKAIASQRTRDAIHTAEHDSIRGDLGAMFAGTIEQAIRKLPVKDAADRIIDDNVKRKQRFGRLWRRNEQYYITPEQLAELKELNQL
jgi:hypothetical protein